MVKKEFQISYKERKRRLREIKHAVASCAIEGMYFTDGELKELTTIVMSYETSDEMVAHLKKQMGLL